MNLKQLLGETIDPSVVHDVLDVVSNYVSGAEFITNREWDDFNQLVDYCRQSIPTTNHYGFDSDIELLKDKLQLHEVEYRRIGFKSGIDSSRSIKHSFKQWVAIFKEVAPRIMDLNQDTFEDSMNEWAQLTSNINVFVPLKSEEEDTFSLDSIEDDIATQIVRNLEMLVKTGRTIIRKYDTLEAQSAIEVVVDMTAELKEAYELISTNIDDNPKEINITENMSQDKEIRDFIRHTIKEVVGEKDMKIEVGQKFDYKGETWTVTNTSAKQSKAKSPSKKTDIFFNTLIDANKV